MTEQVIRATLRLGVQVYLRSERTDRVWEIRPCEMMPQHLRGYPAKVPLPGDTGFLTPGQVKYHLRNKPNNFTTTPP